MRRIGLSLALLFAFSPAVLAQTAAQAPVAESASAADVDRLLQAMDMKTMMAGMMQQMQGAQEKMLATVSRRHRGSNSALPKRSASRLCTEGLPR